MADRDDPVDADQRRLAERFRRLHEGPSILVIPNAWDVASARALAALPGCRAVATTSAAVAQSLGWEDGERAPRDEMLQAAGRMAAAVELPVTADLERGYGDPAGTARRAWEAGIVGINFEDSTGGRLVAVPEQLEAIRAIRAAVPDLVLNARVDVFLRGGTPDEAVERANAYLDVGADCAYPILCPPDTVAELTRRIAGPVNVMLRAGMPDPATLRGLGVARVTWGSGLAAAAYAEAVRIASEVLRT